MKSCMTKVNNIFVPHIRKTVAHQIIEIKDFLFKRGEFIDNPGLMGGVGGEILFFLYFYESFKDKNILRYAISQVEKIISDYDYSKYGYSFAYGLSGIGWLINLMKRKNYIDSDTDDIFVDVDERIYNDSINDFYKNDYDYLSGGLGAAIYFLNREVPLQEYIQQYLRIIDGIKIIDNSSYYIHDSKAENACNLGLSHGIPSIISFLIIAYEKEIEPGLCLKLIRGFVKFLIDNIQDVKKYDSFFAYSTGSTNKCSSRLAWCYGDLSIGFILNKAATILNNTQILNISFDILLHSTQRTDLSKNKVNDACICHGTVGIAHIFNKLFKRTRNQQFKIAAEYWYQRTIEMGHFEDGIAGYKYYQNNNYYSAKGFLEGVAGIGTSLTFGFYNTDSIWDECLLLS